MIYINEVHTLTHMKKIISSKNTLIEYATETARKNPIYTNNTE